MPPSRTSAAGPAIIPILGDQLSLNLTSLRAGDKARDVVVMAEVAEEATYVRHHKKKIAFLFAAMRHFAAELEADGWTVRYVRLDDRKNGGSFTSEVARIARETRARSIIVTEPGEWRVRELMDTWETETGLPVTVLPDERFICARHEFGAWAHGRKSLRMEFFYREMRRKTGLLMDGEEPEGGKWNFDAENRKPAKADLFIPKPLRFEPNAITREVLDLVAKRFANHFGDLEPFWFAVTRADAERQLKHFLKTGLAQFGDYQDAMLLSEPFLYHSILSLYINCGLLDPLDVCRRVEKEYRAGRAPLNAVEGFIRQIIGWREYVRGIYWLKMPDYVDGNFLRHTRPLPDFYWTRRHGHGVPQGSHWPDQDGGLCAPHPAADGDGEFCADCRARPETGARMVSCGLRGCVRMGRTAEYAWYEPIRGRWAARLQTLRGERKLHQQDV